MRYLAALKKGIVGFIFFAGQLLVVSQAQVVLCPPNLNFDQGNFSNWVCRTGQVSLLGNSLSYAWDVGDQPVENRHVIIDGNTTAKDVYGDFPIQCPNGARYVVKLGINYYDRQCESMSYTYAIPNNITRFSIVYYYAVVFEDPGHEPVEQPRFSARVVDNATGQPLDCVSFDFTAAAGLPGFRESTFKPGVLYKDWTPVSIDLSDYAGRTIRLEFTSSDCTKGGHFGYAYFALDPTCTGGLGGNVLCGDENWLTLSAPFGYASYTWYSGDDFAQVVGTDRTLPLTNPATGLVVPVRVVPFPGFGCEDTLYTTIIRAANPVSQAGIDQRACRNEAVPLGAPATPGYIYSWSPSALVSDYQSPQPTGYPAAVGINEFVVRTTDLASGCATSDTVLLDVQTVNTRSSITGPLNYCEGDLFQTTFTAATGLQRLQWYRDNNPIAGATGISYAPTLPGTYYAVVWQNGCSDTTLRQTIEARARPVADFNTIRSQFCTQTPVSFTGTPSISDNSGLTSAWQFSDGTSNSEASPTISFETPGPLNAQLIVTSVNGCADTIQRQLELLPRAIPDFEWGPACTNAPVEFMNTSAINNAAGSQFTWSFADVAQSNMVNPDPVAFDKSGEYTIRLSVVSPGCEDAPLISEQQITVQKAEEPIRYFKKIILPGESLYLSARNLGTEYDWQPASAVASPTSATTRFTATESTDFTVAIRNPLGCTVIDSVEVLLLKDDAVWMPTAFSPNGDGLNDILRPFVAGAYELLRFSIYDRGGNQVYASTRAAAGWDGTLNGIPAKPEVYVWYIEYKDAAGKKALKKGTLTLVR